MSIIKIMLFCMSINNNDSLPKELFYEIEDIVNKTDINSDFFNGYIKEYPNSDYLQGMKLYYMILEKKYKDADEYLNVMLKKNINFHIGTFTLMAKALILAQKNKDKIKYLEESYNIDKLKQNKYVRYLLFDYYFENDFIKANNYIDEALKIDSNYIIALIEKSNILKNQGKEKESINMLDKVIKINGSALAYYYRSMYFSDSGDYENAEKYLLLGLAKEKLPEIYCGLGYIAGIKGDKNKALSYYLEGYKTDSTNKLVLSRLGWYYTSIYDFNNSKYYFEKMIIQYPSYYIEDFYGLIYSYISLDEFINAQKLINKYISTYNNEYKIDFLQILLYSLQKEYKKAQNVIDLFYKRYDDEKVEWMKNELQNWNINIINGQ